MNSRLRNGVSSIVSPLTCTIARSCNFNECHWNLVVHLSSISSVDAACKMKPLKVALIATLNPAGVGFTIVSMQSVAHAGIILKRWDYLICWFQHSVLYCLKLPIVKVLSTTLSQSSRVVLLKKNMRIVYLLWHFAVICYT